MGGYAPRALKDSVRPRRSSSASGPPLNCTVRLRGELSATYSAVVSGTSPRFRNEVWSGSWATPMRAPQR